MNTLIVTEKNKAAQAIAESLGKPTIQKYKGIKIYSLNHEKVFVLPLRGHILSYRNSEKYKSWSNTNPRDIITDSDSIAKKPLKYAYDYINALKNYSRKCQQCIIGTDADIEGCNIGLFDALPFIKSTNPNIRVSQLWLSSLQENEVQKKINNLIQPKWNWAQAGEARAIIDAIIGFSATRELTNSFKSIINKIKNRFISIGRVQTSLLYLIYLREKKIEEFIPEPYFTLNANLFQENFKFKAFHTSNPFKDDKISEAIKIFEFIKDAKTASIKNKIEKTKKNYPPEPLNTSKALILLTRILKINAKVALNTMNDLYLEKIITYPRTESNKYNNDFNHKPILKDFQTHSQYKRYTEKLIKSNKFTPSQGKKDAGDHPPITPLVSLELNSTKFKNNLQSKVYDILSRHYLALFGDPALEQKTKLDLDIKGEPFKSDLISLISAGYLEIAPFLKRKYNESIQIDTNTLPIESIELLEKKTEPPSHYTDTTLLTLMERNGLGTKSTRPVIIQILVDRNYVQRDKRSYVITKLGNILVDNLKEVWIEFLKPDFTKYVEGLLDKIKSKEKNMQEVIESVRKRFLNLFDEYLKQKRNLIKNLKTSQEEIVKDYKERANQNKITSCNCPHCNRAQMKVITTKKGRFLACQNKNCQNQYLNLPNKGKLYILKSRCQKCGFNIFKFYTKKNNRNFSYYMCPNCWNIGYKGNNSKMGFCSNCTDFKIKKGSCEKIK
jgi:DNA topoisomerase-1